MTTEAQIEGLLASANRLRERAYIKTEQVKSRLTSIKESIEGLGLFGRIFLRAVGFFSRIGKPVLWIGRQYKRFWDRFAYTKTRATVLSIVTFLFVSTFTPTWIGEAIRFVTVEPMLDGALMALTYRTETYYLNSTEEIDPANNIHSVRGCRYAGECSEKEAVYFRVGPRLSHDIWKFLNYGNPIYVPDHIIAPIAPGVNECHVTYYGYRMTTSYIARLIRSMQLYPTMLEASCRYVGSK